MEHGKKPISEKLSLLSFKRQRYTSKNLIQISQIYLPKEFQFETSKRR